MIFIINCLFSILFVKYSSFCLFQSGTNKYASQKGMHFGVRHAGDIKSDDQQQNSASVLTGQSGEGSNDVPY